ncbi:hypothetical protein CYMTET_4982 [Cymbomonas tetramitiformis]|uniref:Uncharacterized protein n=1 Tax=Cymbomonas tetramitiformis TaxID=36881 RepID=A0AAE0H0C0_9CHLO|nr:hypothetical protein CYMTET_4982 [Cymbomonas tetramitiformis]
MRVEGERWVMVVVARVMWRRWRGGGVAKEVVAGLKCRWEVVPVVGLGARLVNPPPKQPQAIRVAAGRSAVVEMVEEFSGARSEAAVRWGARGATRDLVVVVLSSEWVKKAGGVSEEAGQWTLGGGGNGGGGEAPDGREGGVVVGNMACPEVEGEGKAEMSGREVRKAGDGGGRGDGGGEVMKVVERRWKWWRGLGGGEEDGETKRTNEEAVQHSPKAPGGVR